MSACCISPFEEEWMRPDEKKAQEWARKKQEEFRKREAELTRKLREQQKQKKK